MTRHAGDAHPRITGIPVTKEERLPKEPFS